MIRLIYLDISDDNGILQKEIPLGVCEEHSEAIIEKIRLMEKVLIGLLEVNALDQKYNYSILTKEIEKM